MFDEYEHEISTTETTTILTGTSTGIPTNSTTRLSSSAIPPPSSTSSLGYTSSPPAVSRSSSPNVYTTMVPVTTITLPTTTFTSYSQSMFYSSSTPALSVSTTLYPSVDIPNVFTCPGKGIDATAAGVLAAVIIPSVIGLLLWVRNLAQ